MLFRACLDPFGCIFWLWLARLGERVKITWRRRCLDGAVFVVVWSGCEEGEQKVGNDSFDFDRNTCPPLVMKVIGEEGEMIYEQKR